MKQMMMQGLKWLVAMVLMVNSVQGAVISTIDQLDDEALFHFAIMSDNKEAGPDYGGDDNNVRVARCVDWIENKGAEFVFGLGDTVGDGWSGGQFDSWMKSNTFFDNHFYPSVGDGENQRYGSRGEGDWGAGAKMFAELNNFWGRPGIEIATEELGIMADKGWSSYNSPSYYKLFENVKGSGVNIHYIALEFSDSGSSSSDPHPVSRFATETKNFMMRKLTELAAIKTSNDMIVMVGHAAGNFFPEVLGKDIDMDELQFIFDTCDFVGDASSHNYKIRPSNSEETGWMTDYGVLNDPNAAVWFNNGQVINDGYVELHVFENPVRATIQYISTRESSRKLVTGTNRGVSTDKNWGSSHRRPLVKEAGGAKSWVDWDNFPLEAPANNAEFISQSVPSVMNPGETTTVSVTMKNTGTDSWTDANAQKLGSQNSKDNTTWGLARVDIGSGNSVVTDQNKTFSFSITAPATSGVYDFQWKMVDDGGDNIGWFGEASPNVKISVGLVAVDVSVSSNDDDMEEQISTGNLAGSSDLEFVHADEGDPDRGDQIVGLRFQNVNVPKGVAISAAYIQFTGDAASAGSGANITMSIAGHDADNSGAFVSGDTSDISDMTPTSSTVSWSPAAWSKGGSGTAERTANISSVIQEIINRGGWSAGNDLSIIISGGTGKGEAARRAEAFDGGVSGAEPKLHIEYGTGPSGPPTITGSTPANNATGVSITTTQITVNFDQSMNGTSVGTAASISGSGATSLSYSSGDGTGQVILSIAGALAYESTYTVTIGTGAQSSGGDHLVSQVQFSFTTESEPLPSDPVVSFDTPSSDVTLTQGDSLYIRINASDPEGISQVRLYKDGVKLGRDEHAAAYEWGAEGQDDPELENLPVGTFVLTAAATDGVGAVGQTASSITVTVDPPPAIGSRILAVDFGYATDSYVETGWTGWDTGSSTAGTAAPTTTIDGYNLALASGSSISCLTTAADNEGFNFRYRSSYIADAGSFTQNELMFDRLASATANASTDGTGSGFYLSVSGLTPDADYAIQVWGVDQTGSPASLKNGYVYGFDATGETGGYSSLPSLGNYTISGNPTSITDDDAWSIAGTVTADSNGTLVYKTVSDIDKAVLNGFTLSEMNTVTVAVPNVVDLDQATAEANLVATGLTVGNITMANNLIAPPGEVIGQNPSSGTQVASGTPVDLVISLGPVGPAGYTYCGHEGDSFALPERSDVAYGANGQFNYLYGETGTVTFNNPTFGDPAPGTYKAGFYKLAPAGYDTWAASKGVSSSDVVNLLEYALDGDTSVYGDSEPTLVKDGAALIYVHPQRSDDPNLSYTLEICTDLTADNWVSTGYTITGTNVTGGTYNNVTNSISTDGPQSYIRLRIQNQ